MTLLTRKEAAQFLRVSLRKIDALAAEGEIRPAKLGATSRARVVYDQDELERYVRKQTQGVQIDFDSLLHPRRAG